MRQVWDERPGIMGEETFERVAQGVAELDPRPEVFIGGYGEPLSHPDVLAMVRRLKSLDVHVELITNATLLDARMSEGLVGAGLDWLWASIDGASPESYEDIRLGAELPRVLSNLRDLWRLRVWKGSRKPHLGVAFVATARNIRDLPGIVGIAEDLGASKVSVSNVLAHTEELRGEALYSKVMGDWGRFRFSVALPRFHPDEAVMESLKEMVSSHGFQTLSGGGRDPRSDSCPFIERGSMSIRWDGAASPCLPLLHSHEHYLGTRLRSHRAYTVGTVLQSSISDIWNGDAYASLRERLYEFGFSPCTACNSCDFADANEEDCFTNAHPACGGCLWAQGFIQCP